MFARKIDHYICGAGLFALVSVTAVMPIWIYDYFWHLTAGRWIVDHRTLPVYDPLAVASAHVPWINGEWLYEVALAPLYALVGHGGICLLNALLTGAIFTLGYFLAGRQQDRGIALLAAAIAFAGGFYRLGVRPAVLGALLLVIALGLLTSRMSTVRLAVFYACLTVVWINIHPSALLAPMLAAITMLSDVRRWIVAAASAVALLINPYGWNAVVAPMHLVSAIRSGAFINVEWLPSSFELYPIFYLTIAGAVALFLFVGDKRTNAWRLAVLILLAALAVRHVRNQGLYFAALPLLLPPFRAFSRSVSNAIAAAGLIPIAWAFLQAEHRPGIDDVRLPVRAVSALRSAGLGGNIYSPDQFGGFIEWTFYPERRALTDGRNELFLDYIVNNAKARSDFEAWESFLAQYQVTVALEDYSGAGYKIGVNQRGSNEQRMIPRSLILYHRRTWALIAFDDAAMVFARRDAFAREQIAAMEYRYIVPDDPMIRFARPEIREAARAEVTRARQQFGDLEIVRKLERGVNQ